jgi:hypothetical protein
VLRVLKASRGAPHYARQSIEGILERKASFEWFAFAKGLEDVRGYKAHGTTLANIREEANSVFFTLILLTLAHTSPLALNGLPTQNHVKSFLGFYYVSSCLQCQDP